MPQSFACLHYHLIFSTKHRQPLLNTDLSQRIFEYIGGILQPHKGVLVAAGGTADHVHLLVSLSRSMAVAEAVRLIKTNSSGWVHDIFPEQQEFAWQTGYGAFAISYSHLDMVRQYLARQEEHHRIKTFQEEFLEFLQRKTPPWGNDSMPEGQLGLVLRHIGRMVDAHRVEDMSDGQLLTRFRDQHDECAFAALVHRHGPLVLTLCRRVLHDLHDAEDAFQATFLVLARKASSIRRPEALVGWLYQTARHIAAKALAETGKRRARERQVYDMRSRKSAAAPSLQEVRAVLDEELPRLPEKYQAPLLLCYLEGKSHAEAARQLGWPVGTVKGRLARARELLRNRLVRRGLTLSAEALTIALAEDAVAARVPAALAASTVHAALLSATGKAVTGAVSVKVAALVDGATSALSLAKVRGLAVIALAAAALTGGAGLLARQQAESKQDEGKDVAVSVSTVGAGKSPDAGPSQSRTDFYGSPLPPGALVRMGSVQLRHQNAHVAFSTDGKTLISAGWDNVIRFWDMNTGRQGGHSQLPRSLEEYAPRPDNALSADGKYLAVAQRDSVLVFDAATGGERHRLPGYRGPEKLVFSPDGKILATVTLEAGGIYVMRLLDLSTGKERVRFPDRTLVAACVFSPDGKLLASSEGLFDNEILCVLDTNTGRELRTVRTTGGIPAFSPDGRTIAVANRYGTATIFETATLKQRALFKPAVASSPPHLQISTSLVYSPDGKLLAVSEDKELVIWDVVARKEKHRLHERRAGHLAFAPDGKTLASAGAFEIHLWDVTTGTQLHPCAGHDSAVRSVAVSPDGKIVASIAMDDPDVRLWDVATGKPLPRYLGHKDSVNSCFFSSDGKLLVTGTGKRDHSLRLWETATGKELRRFEVEDLNRREIFGVTACSLSADGKQLAAVSWSWDADQRRSLNQMNVWEARTGKLLARRPLAGDFDSCFTPDGEGVTVDSKYSLTIEQTTTGREKVKISGDLGRPVAFSPDGTLVAVGIHETVDEARGGYRPKGVLMVEVVSGKELWQKLVHIEDRIEFVAFSADGRVLATAGRKGFDIWDAVSGQQLFQRAWPEGLAPRPFDTPIDSLAFLPGGRAVVTGMRDGTILVWDLAPETWPPHEYEPHLLPGGVLAWDTGNKEASLNHEELDALWTVLAGDARSAQLAIRTMLKAPAQSVALLKEHLQPVAEVDSERVLRLIADLDVGRFEKRVTASRELAKLGEQIEPELRAVLERKPSLETRERVEQLLTTLHAAPSGPALRALRAIQALERIGSQEARLVLESMAKGAPLARPTQEAQASLDRLAKRPVPGP